MGRFLRISALTFSLYIITHLFVFATLPVLILVTSIDQSKIPVLKQWFFRCLFAIVGKKLKVTGYENINPERRYLIISNYPCFYTGFSLIATFPNASIVVLWLLRKIPLVSQVLSRMGSIFVKSGASGEGKKSIDLHLNRQVNSSSMIILPEGKITPDGQIHRFRKGFLYILRHSCLDLLPVTLNGMYQLKPTRRFYLDPDAVPEMVIHAPVANATTLKMSDDEIMTMVRNTISSDYRP